MTKYRTGKLVRMFFRISFGVSVDYKLNINRIVEGETSLTMGL